MIWKKYARLLNNGKQVIYGLVKLSLFRIEQVSQNTEGNR